MGEGDEVLNAMTVDVEEHFQVSAFEGLIGRESWDSIPSRVEANTERLLSLFEEAGVTSTFFVLGWIGERYPGLVRRIADLGHEVASHGYSHRLAYDQAPEEFRREVVLSRRILQDASGQPVEGYRAASFSIGRRNLWALDVLAEAGFAYDSSLFPVYHDRYGIPGAPRHIHRLRTPKGMTLVEVPPSTLTLGRATLPVGGGGYLRIYPGRFSRWAVRRLNRNERMPAVVYVHPWEVDPGQPRIRAGWRTRLRHYWGLRTTTRKLRDLMEHHRFGPIREVIAKVFLKGERGTEKMTAKSPASFVMAVLLAATLLAPATPAQDSASPGKIRFSNSSGTPINQDYFTAEQKRQTKVLLYRVEYAHMHERMWDNFKKGRYNYAMGDLDYTLERFPNHPTALMTAASICKLTGDFTRAVDYFEHALRVYPQYAFTHAQYGSYLVDIDSVDAGIKKLQEAIERDPELAQAHAWLSDAYLKSGETAKAQESAKRARELGFTGRIKVAP